MILKERVDAPPKLKRKKIKDQTVKRKGRGFISYCCTNKMFFGRVGSEGGALVKAIHIHLLE